MEIVRKRSNHWRKGQMELLSVGRPATAHFRLVSYKTGNSFPFADNDWSGPSFTVPVFVNVKPNVIAVNFHLSVDRYLAAVCSALCVWWSLKGSGPIRVHSLKRQLHTTARHFHVASSSINRSLRRPSLGIGRQHDSAKHSGPESITAIVSSCIQFLWRLLPDRGATYSSVVIFSPPLSSRLNLIVQCCRLDCVECDQSISSVSVGSRVWPASDACEHWRRKILQMPITFKSRIYKTWRKSVISNIFISQKIFMDQVNQASRVDKNSVRLQR